MKKHKLLISMLCFLLITISVTTTVFALDAKPATTSGYIVKEDTSGRPTTTSKPTPETKTPTTNIFQVIDKNNKETTTLTTSKSINNTVSTEDTPTNIYMNATFSPSVPDTVKGDIHITIYNKVSKKSYNYTLEQKYNYFLIIEVPVGAYVITKCDIPNNEDGRFIAEHSTFLVGKVMNTMVNLSIIDTQPPSSSPSVTKVEDVVTITSSEIKETSDISTTESIIVESQESNETNIFKKILPIIILVFVLALYFFEKKKKKNKDNTELPSKTNFLNRF